MAAHVAAAGLDPHRYLEATDPADLMVYDAVASEARATRMRDMAEAFAAVWNG